MPSIKKLESMIIVDDDEFTQCQHCKSHLKQYHNTSLCHTSSRKNHYTQTLIHYGHLNCEKCGVYVPIHPEDPNEEGLIFVCSADTPHPYCLCYKCGELYELKGKSDDEEKRDIVSQLMTDDAAQTESSVIGSDATIETPHPVPLGTTLLAANTLATMNMANNGTFIAEMMSNYEGVSDLDMDGPGTDSLTDPDAKHAPELLFLSTIFAVIVWQGMVYAPELLRVSAITVWFLCFYFLISLYFTDNEAVQNTVFSLLTFSPILGALGLFTKMQNGRLQGQMQEDTRLSIQFLCAFGGAAYFWSYCSVLTVYDDMVGLSVPQRVIALFIAVSVLGFAMLLLKNCNFMWYGLRRECTDHDVASEMDPVREETVDLKSLDLKADLMTSSPIDIAEVNEVVHTEVVERKTKKRKRRRRKRRNGKNKDAHTV